MFERNRRQHRRGQVHTNTIDGYWSQLKRGISGTYVSVSRKHLEKYLKEFEYRYNMRDLQEVMFDLLLAAFPRALPSPPSADQKRIGQPQGVRARK